ncbi:MAG: hypothetical protein LM577_08720 [Thermoproteaceae archaeon]|nr:hypothetical protein [Thermoproteaceae archaeon]
MSGQARVAASAALFELPRRLGVPQRVFYVAAFNTEGELVAEGCRRGICVRYRAVVVRRGGRWEIGGPPKRRERKEGGGLGEELYETLLMLSEGGRDVGVRCAAGDRWSGCEAYEIEIDGTPLSPPACKTVGECLKALRELYEEYWERVRLALDTVPYLPREVELARRYPELVEVLGERLFFLYARDEWGVNNAIRPLGELIRRFPQLAGVLRECLDGELASLADVVIAVREDGREACARCQRRSRREVQVLRACVSEGGTAGDPGIDWERPVNEGGREVYCLRGLLRYAGPRYVRAFPRWG